MEQLEITEPMQYFGPLYPYVTDDDITDIDICESTSEASYGTVWLTNSKNLRYKEMCDFSGGFVEAFSKRVANSVSRPFHKQSPVLEAETSNLRITIVHESVSVSGRTVSIRKSLPYVRLTEENILENNYCSREVLNLLKNCVAARMNLVYCGEPSVGKTECAKFFSTFIPDNERVITIEDTLEWHYKKVNPGKDCVELKVNPVMGYTEAIKTSLRLNPKWIMLSETRSKEVVYLLECFSTGVRGMTTLHSDDVRNVPDRMLNMAGREKSGKDMENDIYNFIDVGVLINRREYRDENGKSVVRRFIDQVCFYDREDGENMVYMMVENGEIVNWELPKRIRKKMNAFGIDDPFSYAPAQRIKRYFDDYQGGMYHGRKAAVG